MGSFLCVGRRSECPSDVPHWCSDWILEMGVALSPFACDGTMAPLGRHSEPGPHRRVLAGPGSWGGRRGLPWCPQLRPSVSRVEASAGELGTRGRRIGFIQRKVTEFSKISYSASKREDRNSVAQHTCQFHIKTSKDTLCFPGLLSSGKLGRSVVPALP